MPLSRTLAAIAMAVGSCVPAGIQPRVVLVGDSRCAVSAGMVEQAAEGVSGVDIVVDCVPGATMFTHPRVQAWLNTDKVVLMFGANEANGVAHGMYSGPEVISEWNAMTVGASVCGWVTSGSAGLPEPQRSTIAAFDAWMLRPALFGPIVEQDRGGPEMLDDWHYRPGSSRFSVLGMFVGQAAKGC